MKKPHETKNIQGVFVDIVGKSKVESFLKKFPNDSEDYGLNELIKRYKELYEKHQDGLTEMANVEQLILQMNSRREMSPIKYSTVKGFIYARTPFYRMGYKIKDIRVIVNEIEKCNKMTKSELLLESKRKLAESMNKIIFMNLVDYSSVYNMDDHSLEQQIL